MKGYTCVPSGIETDFSCFANFEQFDRVERFADERRKDMLATERLTRPLTSVDILDPSSVRFFNSSAA